MSETIVQSSRNRILIALNVSKGSLLPLDLAFSLAAHWSANLNALLVEDINLFQFAQLPFAQELNAQSGELKSFNAEDAQRASFTQSLRVRRRLDDAADRLQVHPTLTVVRGHYLREAKSAMQNATTVFLSPRAALARGRDFGIDPSYPTPSTTRRGRSIMVYFDGHDDSNRALMVAVELAVVTNMTLIVLIGSESQDDQQDSSQRLRQLHAKAEALVTHQRIAMNLSRLTCQYRILNTTLHDDLAAIGPSHPSRLNQIVKRYSGDLLVISHRLFATDHDDRALLNGIICPLLVVSALTDRVDEKTDDDQP